MLYERVQGGAKKMNLDDALQNVTRLFLDTAPIIYYVEHNPQFFASSELIFDRIENGQVTAVTSPITLAECLIFPYRASDTILAKAFTNRIVHGVNTLFMPVDEVVADKAARFRAQYNLALADALQIAVAIAASCDVFVTNDLQLKRVTDLRVLVLSEIDV